MLIFFDNFEKIRGQPNLKILLEKAEDPRMSFSFMNRDDKKKHRPW